MEKVRQREIKFRCWDTFSERMIEPYIFQPSSDYDRIEGDERFNAPFTYYETWQDVDDGLKRPCYVMQYTGLKDKNDKDVFEDDIVHCSIEGDNVGNIDVIEFKNGSFWLRYRDRSLPSWTEFGNELEVIGNIWKHPNLLSQGEIKTELI